MRTTKLKVITPEDLPTGTSGEFELRREVLERRLGRSWKGETPMDAGETLLSLCQGGKLWMSDTPDERRSNRASFVYPGTSDPQTYLIGGLGLGFVLTILQGRAVEKCIVVEKYQEVIDLVYPTYASLPWLEVVCDDVFEYGKVGPKDFFDWAYMDVWGDYGGYMLPQMAALRRSLRRVMKPGRAKVACWNEEEIKRHHR
jgi:hypothetical protein